MNKLGNEKLTANEVTFILVGIMLDVSIAGLPNEVTKIAKQDGWISAALGAIYPLYVAFIAGYISKRHPNETILVLSKKYLGSVFGKILNLLFFISIFSYFPAIISLISIMARTYVVPFLDPIKIYVLLFIAAAYTAKKGIKVLGKICTMAFYLIVGIMLISVFVLAEGSFLNISPIFGTGVKNILKGSVTSSYDYALSEVVFLIYPFIEDSSQIKKAALKTAIYTCIIYTWVSFVTIYYMGTNTISKTIWGFFSVTEVVKLEVINNFRYISIFFWMIIALKSVSLMYYFCIQFLNGIERKKSSDLTYFIIAVIVMYIASKYYTDIVSRKALIEITGKLSVIFDLIYITFMAIIIFIKRDEKR